MKAMRPVDDLTAQELRAALDEAIASLPEKYSTPIVLCYGTAVVVEEETSVEVVGQLADGAVEAGVRRRPSCAEVWRRLLAAVEAESSCPGSAWARTAHEAPPRWSARCAPPDMGAGKAATSDEGPARPALAAGRRGGASEAVRAQAEPGHERPAVGRELLLARCRHLAGRGSVLDPGLDAAIGG